MKLTEQDIRRWQANLSSEVNEMMSELLNSLLSRHQYLSSEYFDACRERDKVLQGLYRIDKDLKSVNKQISRGDSDRKVLSEAILNIAKELGIIIAELHRISAQLIAARKTTMTVDELVSGFIEEVRSSKQKWIQSSENIDATYSEMDGRDLPKKVHKLQQAFDQSRLDLFLARAHGDDSEGSIANWRAQLDATLKKKGHDSVKPS